MFDTLAARAPAAPERSPRLAVMAVFLAHGLLFASWTAHIPEVKARLGLSNGDLGFALLGAPIGSVAAMALCAYLLPRLGSRRVVRITLVGYCGSGPLVGLAGSLPALFAAMVVWGLFLGALDVSMNTQAIAVERAQKRSLMFGLHGGWGIGAFAGAGIGALGVGLGLPLTAQLLVVGLPALGGAWYLSASMVEDATGSATGRAPGSATGRAIDQAASSATHQAIDDVVEGGRTLAGDVGLGRRARGVVVVLGAIALASMLCEGAAADWSAVYLRTTLHRSAFVSGLAYTLFAMAMVAVRLSGNRLLHRFPARRLLPGLAGVATLGLAVGLSTGTAIGALIGFSALGAGVALVIPSVFGAAGRIPGRHPGAGVATVSACGWAGFVCGPPLIGQLASATSLPAALAVIPILTAFILVAIASTPRIRSLLDPGWRVGQNRNVTPPAPGR